MQKVLKAVIKTLFTDLERFLLRNQKHMVLNSSTSGESSDSDFDFNVGHSIKVKVDKSTYFKVLYDGTLKEKINPSTTVSVEMIGQELKKTVKPKRDDTKTRDRKRKLRDDHTLKKLDSVFQFQPLVNRKASYEENAPNDLLLATEIHNLHLNEVKSEQDILELVD